MFLPVGQPQSEFRAPRIIRAQVQGCHIPLVLWLIPHPEIGDGNTRTRCHAQHTLIVSVEGERPTGADAFGQFTFGAFNIVYPAELARMGGTDL